MHEEQQKDERHPEATGEVTQAELEHVAGGLAVDPSDPSGNTVYARDGSGRTPASRSGG